MKYLTDNEWKFIKETKFTPTVLQCGEYYKTIFTDERISVGEENYASRREAYNQKWYTVVEKYAKEKYDINLYELYKKMADGDDGISLEFAAPYILYNLYTREELVAMTDKQALEALQDFKYFGGWRKADEMDARLALYDAIKMHDGKVAFTTEFDNDVWYTEAEEEDDCAWDEE